MKGVPHTNLKGKLRLIRPFFGWSVFWGCGCQPKNNGTPKWMVKIMETPIKMDDLGVLLFFGNTHVFSIGLLRQGLLYMICLQYQHQQKNRVDETIISGLKGGDV